MTGSTGIPITTLMVVLLSIDTVTTNIEKASAINRICQDIACEEVCIVQGDESLDDSWSNLFAQDMIQSVYVNTLPNSDIDFLWHYCSIESNSVIIFDDNPGEIVEAAFSQKTQRQLALNLFVIMSSVAVWNPAYYFRFHQRAVTPRMTAIFIDTSTSDFTVTQVLGTAIPNNYDFKTLGSMSTLDLKPIIEKTRQTNTFNGHVFKAGYGVYAPFTTLESVSPLKLGGLMPDLLDIFVKQANLTIKYLDALPHNEGVWSKKLPNSTWTGMLAEVGNSRVDVNAGSFTLTLERHEIVQFCPIVFSGRYSVLVRQPSDSDFAVHPHTLEFMTSTWIGVFVSYFVIWIFVLMYICVMKQLSMWDKKDLSLCTTFKDSLALCLRAYISKGCGVKSKHWGFKIMLLSILVIGMLNVIFYRCMLNAALNVRIINLAFNGWEDILDSDHDVTIWKGGSLESLMKNSPPGSELRRAYEEKVVFSDSLNTMTVDESITHVTDSKTVLFTSMDSYTIHPDYPCKFVELEDLDIKTETGFPFPKDSPYIDIFTEIIAELKMSGQLHRMMLSYGILDNRICETPRSNTLPIEQCILPFLCLLFGVASSLTFVLVEKCRPFKVKAIPEKSVKEQAKLCPNCGWKTLQ